MKKTFRFQTGEVERKKRLDQFLFERIGAVSKMHLRRLLVEGNGFVNDSPEQPGYHLRANDLIEIEIDLAAETSMKPEKIPLEIVFEDEELIVVNKQAGILVHPTRGVKSGTLINALSYYLNGESPEKAQATNEAELSALADNSHLQHSDFKIIRPGLIHRLDKETSGLMVIAKTPAAHRILADHFTRKLVDKKYLAVVEGNVQTESGIIFQSIGYDEELRKWVVSESGKTAQTKFRVLEKRSASTLLELQPVTGRTNQLRIHCEFLGHPIIGDITRGGREFLRLCLHAAKLSFRHPTSNQELEFSTELPSEMRFE